MRLTLEGAHDLVDRSRHLLVLVQGRARWSFGGLDVRPFTGGFARWGFTCFPNSPSFGI